MQVKSAPDFVGNMGWNAPDSVGNMGWNAPDSVGNRTSNSPHFVGKMQGQDFSSVNYVALPNRPC